MSVLSLDCLNSVHGGCQSCECECHPVPPPELRDRLLAQVSSERDSRGGTASCMSVLAPSLVVLVMAWLGGPIVGLTALLCCLAVVAFMCRPEVAR